MLTYLLAGRTALITNPSITATKATRPLTAQRPRLGLGNALCVNLLKWNLVGYLTASGPATLPQCYTRYSAPNVER